ncbi:MAG: tetratricopeptide repeat protein, partial [Woeseiaceae bacterium]
MTPTTVIRYPVLLALLVLATRPAAAADFMAGIEAFKRGDYATALAEWLPMAEGGDLNAMYNVALIYDQGLGLPSDKLRALRWYRVPAEEGDVSAQFNIATIHHFGEGVPVDKKEAARWYRAAALMADEEAQFNLGLMYA